MISEMSEKDYRKHPALNYSSLAAYYNAGISSPDHALMKFDYKSYFEYGKMFESALQDAATGSTTFNDRFFFSKASGAMPEKLIQWIDNGEDLEDKIVYTTKGDRNNRYKTLHSFIDEALENPGKIPVSTDDAELIKIHVANMMAMKYKDVLVGDLLSKAQWQVPITWVCDITGLEKKALLDVVVKFGVECEIFDIKTTANFKQFFYMLKDKYFLQDLHYTEGANAKIGTCTQMAFLVASKEKPFLCQPWNMDYQGTDFRIYAMQEYQELCQEYHEWDKAGRKPKGWLPMQMAKYYPKM